MPSHSELIRLRDGCLSWLYENLGNFNPINSDGTHNFLHSKALTELAFACYCLKRRTGEDVDEYSRRFMDFNKEILENPIYREIPAKNPSLLVLHATQYLALLEYGYQNYYLREILQRAISQGYLSSVERPPFRIMDLSYTFTKGGFFHTLPSLEDLYQRTILAKSPPILFMSMPDAYSVTHTIFYLSDWGFERPKLPDSEIYKMTWTVNRLLELYLLKHNWDLTLELLMCCNCLKSYPKVLYEAAWLQILKAQRKDGSIPGPFRSELGSESSEKTEPFNEDYHTTLAALMLTNMSLDWRNKV